MPAKVIRIVNTTHVAYALGKTKAQACDPISLAALHHTLCTRSRNRTCGFEKRRQFEYAFVTSGCSRTKSALQNKDAAIVGPRESLWEKEVDGRR